MSLLVVPVALLIGLSLGALGGGGSILTVPALVYLLGQDPRLATTSSLVIVGLTSLVALIPHARRGNVRFGQGLAFGALGTAGSFAGAAASGLVPPAVLLSAFAALMVLVAVLMLRRSFRRSRAAESAGMAAGPPMLTLRPFTVDGPRVAKIVLTATGVGLLTGFFGVGGGFAVVPALVLALGLPMRHAVGTSLLVIVVNSLTGLAGRTESLPTVDWVTVVAFAAASMAGGLAGSRLSARTPPHRLTTAFAVLLAVVAVATATQAVPDLLR